MKSSSLARCFLGVSVLFSVSLLIQVTLLVAAEESSCSVVDEETGACSKTKSWVDDVGDQAKQFLQEKIFGQADTANDSSSFLTLVAGGVNVNNEEPQTFSNSNPFFKLVDRLAESSIVLPGQTTVEEQKKDKAEPNDSNPFFKLLDRLAESGIVLPGQATVEEQKKDKAEPNDIVSTFIERALLLNQEEQAIVGLDFFGLMKEATSNALQQLKNTFGDLLDGVELYIPLSMVYYLADEDSRKTPSWKRRQHRFYDKVSKPVVIELHDALYLSQLAYVHTEEAFREGLAKFQNNAWELGYGTTESLPNMPAHFLLIHKQLAPISNPAMGFILPWEGKKDNEIQVTLVVRGTKYLADAIADALLEPAEYRGGHAHGGILASGKALAEKYLPKLQDLLKHSGRDKVRLFLVGHSLGAGAAAIAAMEFKEHDWINVEAVGFGCPSLLSHELSASTKDYITTVVSDADIVPRMSGASMVNMLLELIEYDWTDSALEDIEFSLEKAREALPFGHLLPKKETVIKWSEDFLNNEIRPKFGQEKLERVPSLLIPPGNCIHFFRDGVGYTGTYTPCNFFSSVDLARTLVDDHLIMPGYHRAMINIVRDWEQNHNYDFVHDIASIPC